MPRFAVDLKATAGARGPEVSRNQPAPRTWYRKLFFKCMPTSQK